MKQSKCNTCNVEHSTLWKDTLPDGSGGLICGSCLFNRENDLSLEEESLQCCNFQSGLTTATL